MAEQTSQEHGKPAGRVVFRIPVTALLPAVVLAVCATPLAFGLPGLQVVYLAPIALAYWVLRTRSTADPERIVVRTAFGSRTCEWSRVESLRVPERGWVHAVVSGKEVPLAGVRARHLPVLAAVSGGRLADPSTPPAEETAEAGTGIGEETEAPETPESHGTVPAAEPERASSAAE